MNSSSAFPARGWVLVAALRAKADYSVTNEDQVVARFCRALPGKFQYALQRIPGLALEVSCELDQLTEEILHLKLVEVRVGVGIDPAKETELPLALPDLLQRESNPMQSSEWGTVVQVGA